MSLWFIIHFDIPNLKFKLEIFCRRWSFLEGFLRLNKMLHSNFRAKQGTRKEGEKGFQIKRILGNFKRIKLKDLYQLLDIWQTWMAYYKKHFMYAKILKIEVVFQTLNSQCHDFENRNLSILIINKRMVWKFLVVKLWFKRI